MTHLLTRHLLLGALLAGTAACSADPDEPGPSETPTALDATQTPAEGSATPTALDATQSPAEGSATPESPSETESEGTPTFTEAPSPTPSVEPTPTPEAVAPGTAILLSDDIEIYGLDYQAPIAYAQGDFVQLSGLIRLPEDISDFHLLGTLPEGHCPQKRERFLGNQGTQSAILELTPECELNYIQTGQHVDWVSLSNIRFHLGTTDGAERENLTLEDGFWEMGTNYSYPYVSYENNRVSLGSLIQTDVGVTDGQTIATIPEGYCPTYQKVFSVAAGAGVGQVKVHPDCRITWAAASKTVPTISLAGVSYILDKSDISAKLPLVSPYKESGGYEYPTYIIQGNTIHLTGTLLSDNDWVEGSAVTQIPKEYAPKERLIFTGTQYDTNAQIDILPTGEVLFTNGTTDHNWFGLDDISWAFGDVKAGFVPLVGDVIPYIGSSEYGVPRWHREGDLVVLSGLTSSTKSYYYDNQRLAILPTTACPNADQYFLVNQGTATATLKLSAATCEIGLIGSATKSWIPLSGLAYMGRNDRPIDPNDTIEIHTDLTLPFEYYAFAQLHANTGTVTLTGHLTTDSDLTLSTGTVLGTLPPGRCPDAQHIFAVATDIGPQRVDVLPDCSILWNAPDNSPEWISLSSIHFPVAGTEMSALAAYGQNVKPYGYEFAVPGSYGSRTINSISGLSNGQDSWVDGEVVGTIDPAHCPASRQIFNMAHGANVIRVDIRPDCSITAYEPFSTSHWLSLSGIIF